MPGIDAACDKDNIFIGEIFIAAFGQFDPSGSVLPDVILVFTSVVCFVHEGGSVEVYHGTTLIFCAGELDKTVNDRAPGI